MSVGGEKRGAGGALGAWGRAHSLPISNPHLSFYRPSREAREARTAWRAW